MTRHPPVIHHSLYQVTIVVAFFVPISGLVQEARPTTWEAVTNARMRCAAGPLREQLNAQGTLDVLRQVRGPSVLNAEFLPKK
jgi:hypothetical protein